MSQIEVRTEAAALPAPPPLAAARELVRWLCTKNPFYIISAGLFLLGLWISFPVQTEEEETWALMIGLASYTLLLALTSFLLVRFGNVWDDIRTVLLLVVLMFLATSVTFDELLIIRPARGAVCFVVGFLFTAAVSEAILRGTRLVLRAWFRGPYYLILALFFMYPLALSPLAEYPPSDAMLWGLFGFSAAAGLVFLTLLPAIRRGPSYVSNNGSPWPWPMYPWSLFVFLAVAVPGRAFLLCWSMHPVRQNEAAGLIFGPYFVVTFGLAIAVLLLEIGIVSKLRGVMWAALGLPLILFVVSAVGHRVSDPVYLRFLDLFREWVGASPPYATLLASVGFYLYAALRRTPRAVEALSAALALLAIVNPDEVAPIRLLTPDAAPLLAIAALQLSLGSWRRESWHCLIGAAALALAVSVTLDPHLGTSPLRGPLNFHLALATMLLVGAFFDDAFAHWLRLVGGLLVLLGCLAALFAIERYAGMVPAWWLWAYPLGMAGVLAGYGWLLRYWPVLPLAGLIIPLWLLRALWEGYRLLRKFIPGLDYMAVGLALLAVAILVSLGKSMARRRSPSREAAK